MLLFVIYRYCLSREIEILIEFILLYLYFCSFFILYIFFYFLTIREYLLIRYNMVTVVSSVVLLCNLIGGFSLVIYFLKSIITIFFY